VGILYVVSEETDHSGMIAANALRLAPTAMVVGEPTESKLVRLQKGMLKCRLVSTGVAAHSGYPHLGKSAIDPLVAALGDLAKTAWPSSPELGDTTLNVGIISGGQAANATAEHAEALLMFRAISDPNELLAMTRAVAAKYDGVEVVPVTMNMPLTLGVVEGFDTGIACFNTDIAYFDLPEGSTAYLVGPGAITDAHCPREYINIKEMEDAVGLYRRLMDRLLE